MCLTTLSCKKKTEDTPAPTILPMNSTETAMVGNWIWDKTEYYNSSGTLLSTITPANTSIYAGAFMNLETNPVQNGKYFGEHYFSSSTTGAGMETYWYTDNAATTGSTKIKEFCATPPSYFTVGYINTLTSSLLIIDDFPGATNYGNKIYYHK